jgi:RNA polymerase sigma-70 factor, ECF subfamily
MPVPSPSSSPTPRFEIDALPWLKDVYRYALSLTREKADAEDIVQETYLRAHHSWHTYEPGTDCRRWLFTICRNAFLRSRTQQGALVVRNADDLDRARNLPAGVAHSDDGLSSLDLGPAIDRAMADLPEPFRAAVFIVDVEDQSYEVAAGLLGVPVGTVRSRLFRGRRLLQQRLWAFARDAGLASGRRGPASGPDQRLAEAS